MRRQCLSIGDNRLLVRKSAARKRAAKAKLLAFVLALGVGVAYGQWLETRITLPDSLGGATSPSGPTTDTTERYIYVGDASGDVYVVDAEAGTRVAKVACNSVFAICTDTRQNKVYAADYGANRVLAISCATNQVVATIPLSAGGLPFGLCYNDTDNKMYVAREYGHLTVIDCSSDVVLKTLDLDEDLSELYYNPASNRLFCRTVLYWEQENKLLVIDGANDSVVAVLPDTWYSPVLVAASVDKVYVSNGSGLKALDGATGVVLDSFNARPDLMCYNSHTKKLYACDDDWGRVDVYDCTADTQVGRVWLFVRSSYAMACETTTSRVYLSCVDPEDVLYVIDGIADTSLGWQAGPRQGELRASSKWGRMYSTDHCVPELMVYDLSTDSLLRTITIGTNTVAMCYDATDDKVYYVTYSVRGEAGAIDASTNQPVGHVKVGLYPLDIVWHAPSNRVYCGGKSDVTVIDPTADTATKVLPVAGYQLCSAPHVNKVYAVSYGDVDLAVIDCKNDSVLKTIPLPTYNVWSMCYVSTASYDKLYISANGAVFIVDCTADTLVRSYPAGYSFVVAGRDGKRVHWVTMDSLCTFDPAGDTLVASVPWDVYDIGSTLYIPDVDKLYCECRAGGQDWIRVADGATDSIIAQIPLNEAATLCYDPATKLVCVRCYRSEIAFIDSRTDSVVGSLDSRVDVAALAMASPHRRLYVGPAGTLTSNSSMPVIRTDPPGVAEGTLHALQKRIPGPTILPRNSRLVVLRPSVLLNAAGRKVCDMDTGSHELGCCRAGVYFLRTVTGETVKKLLLVD